LTHQAFADATKLHVNQIKRHEPGTAQPTLDTPVRLTKELHTTLDDLVLWGRQRGPIDDLRLQFEALSPFEGVERKVAKAILEGMALKHNTKRAFADQMQEAK